MPEGFKGKRLEKIHMEEKHHHVGKSAVVCVCVCVCVCVYMSKTYIVLERKKMNDTSSILELLTI
jgi:hypothetical protein